MVYDDLMTEIEPSISNTESVIVSGSEELADVVGESLVTDVTSSIDAYKDFFGETGAVAAFESIQFDVAEKSKTWLSKFDDVSKSNTTHEPKTIGSFNKLAAIEDFSAQVLDNHKPISTVVNAMVGSNRSVVESFYPTIVGDAFSAGIVEKLEFSVVNNQYLKATPKNDNKDFDESIIKIARKANTVFTNEILRLVPVLKTSQEEYFDTRFQSDDTTTGKSIHTAPLLFDKKIDFGAITQTDEDLLNGVRDQHFVLSGDVALKEVYFTLNDSDDNTSSHLRNLTLDKNAKFTPSRTGNDKDILLTYSTEEFIIDADTIKTVSGESSAVIDNLDIPGYKIYLKTVINGRGNTRTNNIELDQPKFKLVKVIDGDGNILAESDQKYSDIKDVVEISTVDSYVLDVYTTNEDLRKTGIELDVRMETEIYNNRYTSPIFIANSILTNSTRNALKGINEYVVTITEQRGIKTFVNYFETLEAQYNNGGVAALQAMTGVTKYIVDPYFDKREISLIDTVDSQESKDIKDNVGGVIANNITQMVNDMVVESGILDAAFKMSLTGTELVIVTDSKIATAINGKVNYEGLNVKVVSMDHASFIDTIRFFITNNKTNELTELTWGFRGVTPTPVITANLHRNGSYMEHVIIQPRMTFHNRLTIGGVIKVTGFDTVVKSKIKKLA